MLLPDTSIEGATGTFTNEDVEPNKTYKMLVDDVHVNGAITDDIEAVKQSVYKILNTERYKHVIYSWNYGAELSDLFGKPMPYCLAEIPRRIRDALIQDDRINDVTNFILTYNKNGDVLAKFVVETIYGDFKSEKGVKIA